MTTSPEVRTRLVPAELRLLERPLGERIEWARKLSNLTQSQLAAMIQTDIESIQRWESGRARPRPGARRSLAWALNRPVAFFQHDGPGGQAA